MPERDPGIQRRHRPDADAPIGARVGIDLAPVDVRDLDQARWLRACVWHEHTARRKRLDAAIRLAQTEVPEVIAGDAAERLAEAADRIPRQQTLVAFHSSTLPYFSDADHARLRAAMRALAEQREVFWLFSEAAGLVADLVDVSGLPDVPGRHGLLGLVRMDGAARAGEVLALTGPHGSWLQWLGAEQPPNA